MGFNIMARTKQTACRILSLSAFALIAIAAADPTSDVVPEDDQVHGILTMPSDHAIMGWGSGTTPPSGTTPDMSGTTPDMCASWRGSCPAGTARASDFKSCGAARASVTPLSWAPDFACGAARCCIAQTPPPATSCGTDIDHLFKCTSRGSVHRRPHKPWKLPCGDDGVCQEKECCKLTCKDFSCAKGKHCAIKAVSRRPFKPEKLGCSWDIGCSCNTCCKQA